MLTFAMASPNTSQHPTEPAPWHVKYPEPKTVAPTISREEVRDLIVSIEAKNTYVLIDLRRADHEVSCPDSTNIIDRC